MRPYEFPDHIHLQITFEFDLTLYRIDRDVYSILDWVGDVGGLNEGLYLFFKMILLFCQFNELHHFLIERLYRTKGDDTGAQLKDSKTSCFRFKFNICMPSCLVCGLCRLRR